MKVAAADARRLPIFIHSELDDMGLDVYAFRVYCRLARRAGQGGTAYESVGNMADACRMSSRRAREALRDLERLRLVKRDEREGQPSVYTLMDSRAWQAATPAPHAGGGRHHVPGGAAPGAAKGTPVKVLQGKELLSSADADASQSNGKLTRDDYDRVLAAYNAHRDWLPEARVMNSKRRSAVRTAVRDLGSVDEVAAALAVAAAEAASDPFWRRNRDKGWGIDTLLAGQKFVQKAEAAVSRGTTDRTQSAADAVEAML